MCFLITESQSIATFSVITVPFHILLGWWRKNVMPLNTDMRILDHVSRRKICYAQHLQVQMTLQQHLSRAHENLIQEILSLTSDTDSLPLQM